MNLRQFFVSSLFFCAFSPAFASDCGFEYPIIQKPIVFDKERIALTQEYRRVHYGIDSNSIHIIPKMIVLHWTAINNLPDSFAMFNPPTLENRPDLGQHGKLNTSAHFLVARDGTIYQLMPANIMARHVIGLNNIAIGIENVGGFQGKSNLTPKQVTADSFLVCKLKRQYPEIQYLIGHFEYGNFRNTPLWLEKDKSYFTIKEDPGADFMKKVRARVKGWNLKSSLN